MIDALYAIAALASACAPLIVGVLALAAVVLVIEHREKLAAQVQVNLGEAQEKAIEQRLAPLMADVSSLKIRLNMQQMGETNPWK